MVVLVGILAQSGGFFLHKELIWIETHNHIELYDQDPYVSEACAYLVRWLDANLKQ